MRYNFLCRHFSGFKTWIVRFCSSFQNVVSFKCIYGKIPFFQQRKLNETIVGTFVSELKWVCNGSSLRPSLPWILFSVWKNRGIPKAMSNRATITIVVKINEFVRLTRVFFYSKRWLMNAMKYCGRWTHTVREREESGRKFYHFPSSEFNWSVKAH